ncbi:DUF3068 domain-containing protein [Streptomyces albireticuli]|uniref:DUF3068 domain-containing protein n=1 Tax=Streptomyces albireticuli TaxID=1940 RepID=A0A2A2DCH6_9ACTN|nr:DUF3068 domain-containing protein [Streptomyces albireticuli]MCD9142239.1 DUF3068 domain-containing protein [Streptomyces albireticuli]MCD9162507.1 DUF3068 domain-containing protein [Streptomyces albireticuli]MCD9190413.1 DUF3068 domain-containing protein [Streptomyces albireticuli]PAU49002.1 hypothetical protein CK936_10200 [Streptomyces albireticuli]
MRRRASLILLALAVFLLALAPLLRWYAFPRLAKVPAGRYQAVVMEAKDATLIDYATLKPRTVPKLTMIQTLKGNAEEAAKVRAATGRDVVVWDTLTFAAGPDGAMVSRIPERYVFDAHSQRPVHAGGEHVDGTPVRRDGIAYKWPFLVQKRDYRYFDMQTRTSAPIHYRGTRAFRGLDVYYFEQTIPWTQVPLPRALPLGITPDTVRQIGLERWYTTKRMFWVDPVTGAPVNGEEVHREEMRWTGHPEKEPITAFAGHVKMRPDYLDATLDLVTSQRRLVLLLTTYLPWGSAGLGAVLLALALVLEARSRRAPAGAVGPPRDRRADGVGMSQDGGTFEQPTPGGGR